MIFIDHSFVTAATTTAVILLLSLSSLSHQQLLFVSSQTQQQEEPISDDSTRSGEICDNLSIGSYYFININAWPTHLFKKANDTHHGEVIVMGFEDIPGGLDLYLTDRAWSFQKNKFVEEDIKGDGILKLTTPAGVGIPGGVPFGVGDDTGMYQYGNDWIDYKVNGTKTKTIYDGNNNDDDMYYFDLGDDGDQVFLYCIDSNGNDRPITGLSYNGPFVNDTKTNSVIAVDGDGDGDGDNYYYGTNMSSAPDYLLNTTNNGTLVMPRIQYNWQDGQSAADSNTDTIFLQWQYIGPLTGLNFYELQEAVQNTESNWLGINPDGTTTSSSASTEGCPTTSTTKSILITTMMTTTIMVNIVVSLL